MWPENEITPTSWRYSQTAVIRALKKFRVYLLGQPFKIVADCKAFEMIRKNRGIIRMEKRGITQLNRKRQDTILYVPYWPRWADAIHKQKFKKIFLQWWMLLPTAYGFFPPKVLLLMKVSKSFRRFVMYLVIQKESSAIKELHLPQLFLKNIVEIVKLNTKRRRLAFQGEMAKLNGCIARLYPFSVQECFEGATLH